MSKPWVAHATSRARGACLLLLLATALGAGGCAKLLADQTAELMIRTTPAMESEPDPVIAEAAMLSGLKTIEGLLSISPKNEKLLMTVTQSFAGYGAAFVEPEWVLREDFFSDEYLETQRRLQGLYRRSRDTGLRWIELRHPGLATLLRSQVKDEWVEALPEALAKLSQRDVPSLFWTAQAWGLLIRVDDENFIEIANMAKVDMLMRRVYELDPDYNFGAVHLYFGMVNATLGRELGGNLEQAREYFEKAIAVTDGSYLTNRYF